MSTGKLSTGGGVPSSGRKKREGKKRKSPCPPLREKGKGKEQDGGLLINPLCNTARARESARAHARRLPCTCSYAEAGEAAAEIVANCFPHCAKDVALWAWYCRHFDRSRIVDRAYFYASCQWQGEVRDAVTAFQAWLRKEFPKKEPASAEAMARQGGAA